MARIKFLQKFKGYKKNEIAVLCNNIAHGLIEKGIAKLHKIKEFKNYRTTRLKKYKKK